MPSNFSQSPPSGCLLGWFSLIQSDQKQHSFGVVEEGVETVLGVGVMVVVVPVVVVVVLMVVGTRVVVVLVVVGTGVVVMGVEEETGVGVDTQMLKCFSVPLGTQISQ